jgi:hypothetical protein
MRAGPSLTSNALGAEGTRHVSYALASRDGVLASLRKLWLGDNSLGTDGMRHLSGALASRDGVLANLQELDLGWNTV